MEDLLLVSKCKCGSKEALQQIYKKYKSHLLVLAYALSNDAVMAEDVLHDVFTTFIANLDRFTLTGSLKAYLAKCVTNRIRNNWRSKHRRAGDIAQADEVTDYQPGPLDVLMVNEELKQLADAIAKLPPDQAEIVALRVQGGLKLRAIAQHMDLSINTVKSRYRYGLEKLRQIMNGVQV